MPQKKRSDDNKYKVPDKIWESYTPEQRRCYNSVRDFIMLSKGNFLFLKNSPQAEWELMAKVIAQGVSEVLNYGNGSPRDGKKSQ